MIVTQISIDLSGKNRYEYVVAKQGDADSRLIQVLLLSDSRIYVIDNQATARVLLTKPDKTEVLQDCEVNNNMVEILLDKNMLAVAGTAVAEILLTDSVGTVTSASFDLKIVATNTGKKAESSNEYQSFKEALAVAENLKNDVAQRATRAELEIERKRIERLIALEEGSIITDAERELADLCIGADGVAYETPGEAVRTQFENVTEKQELNSAAIEANAEKIEGILYPVTENITIAKLASGNCWDTGYYSEIGTVLPEEIPKTIPTGSINECFTWSGVINAGDIFGLHVAAVNTMGARLPRQCLLITDNQRVVVESIAIQDLINGTGYTAKEDGYLYLSGTHDVTLSVGYPYFWIKKYKKDVITDEQVKAAVKEWLNEHPIEGVTARARISEVTLSASGWHGDISPYSQVVQVNGVTENSKVDLTPSVQQLSVFYEKDITFVTENESGVVTVYAIGQKPQNDYTIQVTITEVDYE